MKRSIGLLTTAAIAAVAGASPASAQYYPSPRVVYVPAPAPAFGSHQADAVIRSLGLRPIGRAQARGPVLVMHALGQEGSPVIVTLDRHSGRVLGIVRTGYGAPRMARVPGPGGYDLDEEDYAFLEDDLPPPGAMPDDRQGPSVITRRGIDAGELPPVVAPRGPEREPYYTGSIPRSVYRTQPGGRDPLVGVPKEFRGQESRPASPQPRVAARGPEPLPRSAPMPRPRPAEAADVAVRDASPHEAKVKQEKSLQHELSPAAKADAEKYPPMQGFE